MDRPPTILLVEDENGLRTLVAQFLRSAEYAVVEAADGPEGVARFADSGPFDLALLDVNLPGYCGVEVCRRIKTQSPEQRVLVCSAAIVRETEDAFLAMGVDRFLTKPYHPEVLLAHIARLLRPPRPVPGPSFLPGSLLV